MANQQLNAKLVNCNIPTKNSAAAQKFYNTLFGGDDFAPSLNDKTESQFRPISQDGLTLTIGTRQNDREPITCYFAVDNLDQTVSQLVAAGGKVVLNKSPMPASAPAAALKVFQENSATPQQAVPSSWGDFVTMLDPDGNYLGIMQLAPAIQPELKADPPNRKLSQEQVQQHENWKQKGAPLLLRR